MNIGKSVAVALAKSGMKSEEAAKKIGITRPYLSMLKSKPSVSGDMLQKLADAFEMPVSEFVKLGE